MLSSGYTPQKIVLSPSEFAYMQRMLDHGYLMSQAIQELRPNLRQPLAVLNRAIVTVQRSSVTMV